jgi:hypothetical protein
MAKDIGTLSAKTVLDSRGFSSGVDKVTRDAKRMQESVGTSLAQMRVQAESRVNRTLEAMKTEIDTINLSANAIQRASLAREGANAAQLQIFDQLAARRRASEGFAGANVTISALREEIRMHGLSALEAQRAGLAKQGATTRQLHAFDQLAALRERQLAREQQGSNLGLAGMFKAYIGLAALRRGYSMVENSIERVIAAAERPGASQGLQEISLQLQGVQAEARQARMEYDLFVSDAVIGTHRLARAAASRMIENISQGDFSVGGALTAGFSGVGSPAEPGGALAIEQAQRMEEERHRAIRTVGAVIKSMERQVSLHGLTAEAAARASLVERGASESQLRAFDKHAARLREINRLKEEGERTQRLGAEAASIIERGQSPLEQIRDQMLRIRELQSMDFLTQEEATRATARLAGQLPQLGRAPLLESLSAVESETGRVLQESFRVDDEEEENAGLEERIEAMIAEEARNTEAAERTATAMERLLEIWGE